MKIDKFESQIFFTTVRITVPNDQGTGASIGTGFIYKAPIMGDSKNRTVTLLISNKHVFGNPTSKLIINFHKKNAETSEPILREIVTVQWDDFTNNYFAHPNANVDLACLNISPVINTNQIYYKNIHDKFLGNFDESEILPGSDIFFIGYPENRFDVIHNLPILRKGILSTILDIDFNGEKQFVIDAQVLKGSSGSPVFVTTGGHYKLAGVISATMIKHQQLMTIPAIYDFGIEQTLGLGIVLKKILVEELIQNVVAKIKILLDEKEKNSP